MARNTPLWIAAFVLATTGCTTTPDLGSGETATTVTSSATQEAKSAAVGTTAPDAPHLPTQEVSSLSSTTTTTEAPVPTAATLPPVIVEFDLDDFDVLIDELDGILADLDQSLTEQEGDIFDD